MRVRARMALTKGFNIFYSTLRWKREWTYRAFSDLAAGQKQLGWLVFPCPDLTTYFLRLVILAGSPHLYNSFKHSRRYHLAHYHK